MRSGGRQAAAVGVEPLGGEQDHGARLRRPGQVHEHRGILAQVGDHGVDCAVVDRAAAARQRDALPVLHLDQGRDVHLRLERERLARREAQVRHGRRHHRIEPRLADRAAGRLGQEALEELLLDLGREIGPHAVDGHLALAKAGHGDALRDLARDQFEPRLDFHDGDLDVDGVLPGPGFANGVGHCRSCASEEVQVERGRSGAGVREAGGPRASHGAGGPARMDPPGRFPCIGVRHNALPAGPRLRPGRFHPSATREGRRFGRERDVSTRLGAERAVCGGGPGGPRGADGR